MIYVIGNDSVLIGGKIYYLEQLSSYTMDFGKAMRFDSLPNALAYLDQHSLANLNVYRIEITESYTV